MELCELQQLVSSFPSVCFRCSASWASGGQGWRRCWARGVCVKKRAGEFPQKDRIFSSFPRAPIAFFLSCRQPARSLYGIRQLSACALSVGRAVRSISPQFGPILFVVKSRPAFNSNPLNSRAAGRNTVQLCYFPNVEHSNPPARNMTGEQSSGKVGAPLEFLCLAEICFGRNAGNPAANLSTEFNY